MDKRYTYVFRLNLIKFDHRPKTVRDNFTIKFNPHWLNDAPCTCFGITPLMYDMLYQGKIIEITDNYHQCTEYFGRNFKNIYTYNN